MTPEIILGPPGTGKTTSLINILEEELANGVDPSRIGYLSFTRRAADEAITRSLERFRYSRSDFPWFRTLHSLAFRFMGLSSRQILEGARLTEFADYIGERVTGRFSLEDGSYLGYESGDRMLFMDNLARVRGVSLRDQYDRDADDIDWRRVERFSKGLSEYKRKHDLIDFTDMLERFATGNGKPDLDILLVDEAQDLSRIQWRIIDKIGEGCRRIVVAGDDDQAIYRWAGADVDYLINLRGEARVLDQSYRVPRKIQALANSIISRVKHRRDKDWNPRDEDGVVEWHRSIDSVNWAEDASVLVLARNAHFLRRIQTDLHAAGILYEHHGHSSVSPSLVAAIVAWEKLRRGESVEASSVRKVYEHMTLGIGVRRGHKTLPGVPDDRPLDMGYLKNEAGLLVDGIWHEVMDRVPAHERAYIVRCRRRGERISQPPRIRLSTIHGSKGGQADRVVLLSDMAPRTEMEYHRWPDDEHRAWYVGVTRARQRLQIVDAAGRRAYRFQ